MLAVVQIVRGLVAKMKNNKHGFTMAELLITIAIVGILSAIAIPHYLQNEAAKISEPISQLNAINLGEQSYQKSTGNYFACIPATPGALDPCWATISVDDPHLNPQHAFDYSVVLSGALFCSVATRNGTGSQAGKTVCLDSAGSYYGSHPNGPNPSPPNAAAPVGSGCTGTC